MTALALRPFTAHDFYGYAGAVDGAARGAPALRAETTFVDESATYPADVIVSLVDPAGREAVVEGQRR